MKELVEAALQARELAYAPYSGYMVGAAVRSGDRIWTGCNIENVVYGETICAERTAIFKMVSEGVRDLAEIAVATKDGGSPCGACLQVISEFVADPEILVHLVDGSGEVQTYLFEELLPHSFRSKEVRRTER